MTLGDEAPSGVLVATKNATDPLPQGQRERRGAGAQAGGGARARAVAVQVRAGPGGETLGYLLYESVLGSVVMVFQGALLS